MKNITNKIILIAASIFFLPFGEALGVASFAQNVGINTTGNAPNSSALLDVNASPGNNKGVLIPRLPLTATNSGNPISPLPGVGETGLMVYNTATAGVSPNDVVPGFYYWNGTAWAPLGGGGSTGGGWTDDGTVVRLTTSTDFVGIGTASPSSTSALDITSTTKGILIPRMTTAQRDAITTPATGLQIYNTDCKVLNYWSGSCWISMSKSLPNPGQITSAPASTVFCAGQSRTYTIAAVPGSSSYTWTVPAGTTINSGQGTVSINATFGNISGSVCVNANNACETSGQTCLAVSVDPIPNTPGNITGITSINPGQTSVTYFVASVNGASTYTWSVPAGATIASGTGTTTIVVNFACTASSGNISVTANSTCGSSPASALALTITPLLAVNAGSAVFGGTTIGGNATGGTAAYTYSWNPTSNLSSSTTAIPIAQCTGSSTTYTVTVTDSRTCTASSSVLVTRNLAAGAGSALSGPGAIGGSPTATGGASPYTYSWSPTSNISSSTVANPTATACTTTTYTVTVTDANTCSAISSGVTVTKNLVASAGANRVCNPGAIGGSPTASGGNASYTYSWNPGTGLSSTTIANPTSTVTSTTSYTVTVTDGNSFKATSAITITLSAPPFGSSPFTINNTSTGANGTIQNFMVPCGVTSITIEAWGAQGGTGAGQAGGLGARMKGTFTVTPGDVLKILVGQQGVNGPNSSGGGGGTFVTTSANSPLIVAGGGAGGSSAGAGNPGVITTTGGGSNCCAGGAGGAGGGAGCSGGGGGLTGNGTTGTCAGFGGGQSFTNGGAGGTWGGGNGGPGGFGGGGSGEWVCCGTGPGGGGYSGGAGASSGVGGGGGSYNGGTAPSNSGAVKSGMGQVQITY